MASGNHLAEIMTSVAKRMRADFDRSKVSRHGPSAGRSRETIVLDFLQAYLPRRLMAVHGGEILSSQGEFSKECDILLVDRDTPPFTDTNDLRIVPIECVHGVVEVKSNLTKNKLIEACENIRAAKRLQKTAFWNPAEMQEPDIISLVVPPTFGLIFAFNSPSLKSVTENLRQWTQNRPKSEWPDSVWILGKGQIGWWNRNRRQFDVEPWPDDVLGFADPPEDTDILLTLALTLNILYSRNRNCATLRLADYIKDEPLARNLRFWEDEN
jgi:hypothetical protein